MKVDNASPQTPKAPRPKVLIVDDEESILSAARRLLRGRPIDVLTTTSAKEALDLVKKEDCWVVVSDYRMPDMTGTELLEDIKRQSPQVSRLMLTGFLELPIIQEAINRASVFRFITKPWDETELLLGIETAIQHSGRQRTNLQLAHEIGHQNQRLEQLTKNLESEVLSRTQTIEESTRGAESKQRSVRELTGFVKDLSSVSDQGQLFEVLFYEMQKFPGVPSPYMLVLDSASRGKLFWMQSRILHEKIIHHLPEHFQSLSVRTSSPEDRTWWQENIKKDCRELVAIPIRARETSSSHPVAILFVEHNLDDRVGGGQFTELLERVTERLQPVSVVLDKILLKEQLSQATEQWEATFNGFQDPIAVVDNQERVIRANSSFFKPGPQRCHEMLDNRDDLCEGCPMPQAILKMEPSSSLVRTSTNKTLRVHSYPVVVSGQNEERVVRVVNHYTDISRERDLYMKLVQSEKLAAVGLLAGNIAHELNNPLSGIRALAQILGKEIDPANPHLSDIVEIEKATVRCQLIIRNLLNFSESSREDYSEEVSVNELIESTMPLLKTAIRNQRIQTFYGQNLPFVQLQPSQMQQVVFNLINNACQAMAQGGTLLLKTWGEGSWVCFSVTDTGPGIPDEIQSRIFEPFFTTKGVGMGTGLGLSVSRSIVEKFGGKLKLDSHIGQGTTFTVMLPSGIVKQ